jgi:hypothetical protein
MNNMDRHVTRVVVGCVDIYTKMPVQKKKMALTKQEISE